MNEQLPSGEHDGGKAATSLGRKAARGAATMMLGQIGRVVIQTVSVVLLARLLSPADFGIVAMVTAIVGIGGIVRDFGLGQAAVQATSISWQQKSNLFWLNLAIGAAVSVIAFSCASFVSDIYNVTGLTPIVQALSITFLLGGASTQFRAELSRRLQFRHLMTSEIFSQASGVVTAVILAILGFGYWALIIQQIVDASLLLLSSAVLSRWHPCLPSRQPMKTFFRFGWGLLGTQLILYFSQNIDSFLIGKKYGAASLGFYNRAFQLLMLPLNQVSAPAIKVALPVLSRLQNDRARFDKFLLRANLVVGTVVILALTFAASQAPAMIEIILGPQWSDSVVIFQILAIAGCFQTLSYASYWTFLARGRTLSNLRFTLITRSAVALLVVGGAQISVTAVAALYSLGLALSWPLSLMWIRRWGPSRQLFIQGCRLLIYGILFATCSAFTSLLPISDNPWLRLVIGFAASSAALGLALVTLPVCRQDLREVLSTVRLARNPHTSHSNERP